MPKSLLGQGSLFERLEPDTPPLRMRTREQLAAERVHAIRRHLQWLLNSRKGGSLSSPDLGLQDFNDAVTGSADLLLQVRRDFEAMVAAFEPRISVLGVRACPDAEQPLDLHFRLDCVVPVFNKEEQVEIELVIHHQNRLAQIV
jgi:type VI secretion system protein